MTHAIETVRYYFVYSLLFTILSLLRGSYVFRIVRAKRFTVKRLAIPRNVQVYRYG